MLKTAKEILEFTLKNYFSSHDSGQILALGENVNVGSHISGLSAVLRSSDYENVSVVNMPNVESITGGVCITEIAFRLRSVKLSVFIISLLLI